MKALISFVSFLLLLSTIQAQPGSLDITFGNNGIVTAPNTSIREMGYKILLQDDGKILLAGFQEDNNIRDFAVARYNPDGSLDNSFGSSGLVIFDAGTGSDAAWSMALQDDGKIILAGTVYHQFSSVDDMAMVRLNSDGTPDNSFGTAGFVFTDIDQHWDNANDIALQPDGKILLAGEGYANDKRNVCVVRYNSNGGLDASFGTGGIALFAIGTGDDRTESISLQSDGKILTCGYFDDGVDDQTYVARFNTDGSVDNTFGNNGRATLDIGGNNDRLKDLYLLDNGNILAGGFTTNSSNETDYLILRYLPDGTLDNGFGSNGIMMHNVGANDFLSEIAVQSDGKILTAGGAFSFEMLRLLENGSRDPGFGDNGMISTPIGVYSFSMSLCLQSEDKVILAGQSKESGGEFDLSLARYHLEDAGSVAEQDAVFQNIKVYPNPARDKIFVNYSLASRQILSIDLLCIDGKILHSFEKEIEHTKGTYVDEFMIPDHLTAGMYLIRMTSDHGSIVKRLAIQ